MLEIQIEVTDRKGRVSQLAGAQGLTLMEVLKARGMPVAATCGGAKSCATCHVYLEAGYELTGPPADEDELDLLSESDHYRAGKSRLSCQIVLAPVLSGLRVELAPQD
jgi:ferredoxin, 2Fe-2S